MKYQSLTVLVTSDVCVLVHVPEYECMFLHVCMCACECVSLLWCGNSGLVLSPTD